MELKERELRDAWIWFFAAGAFAILLSMFVQTVDFKLSTSDREKVLGETLRELRGAQAEIASGAVDERLSSGIQTGEVLAPHSASEKDHH